MHRQLLIKLCAIMLIRNSWLRTQMEEKLQVLVGVVVPPGKEFALPAFRQATRSLLGDGFTVKKPGMPIEQQRKIMVDEAVKRKMGLLLLDCDIIPPENVLDLLRVKAAIVGGAYLGWQDMGQAKIAPCAYAEADKGIAFIPVDYLIKGQVLPVAAVGFGCAYLSLEVMKKIPYPSGVNEDVEFCRLAREKGFVVGVHSGVKCVRKTPNGDLSWPVARAGLRFTTDV